MDNERLDRTLLGLYIENRLHWFMGIFFYDFNNPLALLTVICTMFFAKAGFPCPCRRNPSDHFVRCINSDFDAVTTTMMTSQRIHEGISSLTGLLSTAAIKAILIEKYRWSEHATTARARIKQISDIALPTLRQR
ncbi:ABC transporter G family member 15 [Spatholobus suberectus]|nr:ABC transporter G family member 15 [Spatholobus suberectus]